MTRPGIHLLLALLPALAAGSVPAKAAEVIPPSPSPHYIVDEAAVLSPGAIRDIDQQLEDFERATSNQIVVAIYPKLQTDDDIAACAVRVFQAWKIGQKGRDNGVLLLVSTQDHRMAIQVGYGLEGALPDATAKTIIDQEIAPRFKAGDFDGGIREGVNAIIAASKGEYKGNGAVVGQKPVRSIDSSAIVFLLFLAIAFIIAIIRARRGTVYSSRGSSFWWTVFGMMLNSGGSFQVGGGSSGGGGGGFSGGGGRSGGGGASGSW